VTGFSDRLLAAIRAGSGYRILTARAELAWRKLLSFGASGSRPPTMPPLEYRRRVPPHQARARSVMVGQH
jgi:hypothetical protein